VSFTVEAENAAAYVWQYSKNNGETWTSWTSSSYKKPTLTLSVTAGRMAMVYRCQVTGLDGENIYSDAVGIMEPAAAEIISQPESVVANIGDSVSFTVEAENATAYVWQYSKNNGESWTSWTSSSYKQPTLTLTVTAGRLAMIYRCQVTGQDGENIYSDAVGILTFQIVQQPENVTASIGATVTFTVEANGAETYQWQYSKDEGETWTSWTSASYKQPSISMSVTAARQAMVYRCILSDANGNELVSEVVRILKPMEYEGVIFELNDDGNLTVIDYTGNSTSVVVPESFEGYTVTVIGECAFENKTFIESIDLPDTITVIRRRAFAGCTSLCDMH